MSQRGVAHGDSGLPMTASHHWRSWNKPACFLCVFSSPSTGNLRALRLPGASLSDHLTELVCFLEAKRHGGLEFLQQRQSSLCFFHPAAVGSALLAPLSALREIIDMIVRRGLSSCPDTNPRVHVRYLITLGRFLPADFGASCMLPITMQKNSFSYLVRDYY